MSVCTACGEFYTYRGHLHCPPGAPVTVQPKPDWSDDAVALQDQENKP